MYGWFQFTRARGARPARTRSIGWSLGFNSRAHGARDLLRDRDVLAVHVVSIHARTGRATLRACPRRTRDATCFNSRAHGARDKRKLGAIIKAAFQFTRARGARQGSGFTGCSPACFNSRAHGARDGRPRHPIAGNQRFQFTRARGARLSAGCRHRASTRFTSRAHGARDQNQQVHAPGLGRFNSRAHGARDDRPPFRCKFFSFQFTRARGARPSTPSWSFGPASFQFTRARGARRRPRRGACTPS